MQTNYARSIKTKLSAPAQEIACNVHNIYSAMKNPATRRWVKAYMKDIVIYCKYIVNVITDETKRDTEQTAAMHKHL